MNIAQVLKHYGTQARAAEVAEVSVQAVNQWKKKRIPIAIEHQIKFELDSRGVLKADLPKEIRATA